MLGRSISFSALQATASVLLAAATAVIIAFSTQMLGPRWRRFYMEILRTLGLMIFFSPTIVAALSYLKWAALMAWLPKFGWTPIIFVHVCLNALFLASAFAKVIDKELRDGRRLFEVAQIFGLSRFNFYLQALLRPLRQEFMRWLPLIFWWSFSSFTTVLVLGGGPRYSSPEVLLFYLIGAGDRPARLYVLIIIQILVGLAAIVYARRQPFKPATLEQAALVSSEAAHFKKNRTEKFIGMVGLVMALVLVGFWLPALVQALRALKIDGEVWTPLTVSAQILWRAAAIGVVALGIGVFFSKHLTRLFSLTLVVSPMVLIGTLMQTEWLGRLSQSARLWLTAALCAWTTLPMLGLWVLTRQQEFLQKTEKIRAVFDPRADFRMRYFYLPVIGLSALAYLQILFLAVLGDVGIVSSVLGSAHPSLAQMIYGRVSAYHFDAAFSMFGYLMLSVLPVWIVLAMMRRKNEIRNF